MNRVSFTHGYFPEDDRGRPIANGYLYVGEPDTDPTVVGNQKDIYVQQETGTIVSVSQPLRTNSGGQPTYSGSPVTLLTSGNYSLTVHDSNDNQVYYIPSVFYNDEDIISAVLSYSDLRAITGTTDGEQISVSYRSLLGDGGGGLFQWDGSDLSTEVTADTESGIYIAPTSDTTGASGAWVRVASDIINVKWFGAKGDGATNDTAAFLVAQEMKTADNQFIEVGSGTFLVNLTNWATQLRGSGDTILKSFDGESPVIDLDSHGTATWDFYVIENINIDGNGMGSHGIKMGTYAALTGRYVFNNVSIINCDACFYKSAGNIGNLFNYCFLEESNYGIFAVDADGMNSGIDTWFKCNIEDTYKAGVYYSGQTTDITFIDCIIEGNTGFGLFMRGSGDFTSLPVRLQNTWFEANADGGTVDIDDLTDLTPVGVRFDDMKHVLIDGGSAPDVCNNSIVTMRKCYVNFNESVDIETSDSYVKSYNTQLGVLGKSKNVFFESIDYQKIEDTKTYTTRGAFNGRIPFRTFKKPDAGNLLFSIPFNTVDPIEFKSGALTFDSVPTSGGFFGDSYVHQVTIPASSTYYSNVSYDGSADFDFDGDKYYIFTINIRSVSGEIPEIFVNNGIAGYKFAEFYFDPSDPSKWSCSGAFEYQNSFTNCRLRIQNDDTSDCTIEISNFQVVEFDTYLDAFEYLNSGAYME